MSLQSFTVPSDSSNSFSGFPNPALLPTSIDHPAPSNSLSPALLSLNVGSSSPNSTAANTGLGTIQGQQWNDLNGNGLQEANEPGLAGWTIYLDQDRNGQLDSGEQSTTTDANGNYTFTGLQPGTYTVAVVSQAGWKRTSPTQDTSTTLIPVTNRRDLIFDPLRNVLYMTTSTGKVERYDVATQSLLAPWQVGNSLNGGDITSDGSALYIAENQQGATQGFIRKVNLADGTVKNLTFALDYDDRPSDIAIASNGLAIFRGFGQWQPYRQIDLSTDTISTRSSNWSIYGGSMIARSSDRSLLFIPQEGISSGPIATYNATTNTFSDEQNTDTYLGTNLSAVNRNGSLIALEWGTGISILDQNLNSVENLTDVDGGVAFDPQRDILYAVNSTTDQVIAFNTNTWKELYRLNIGEDMPSSNAWDTSSRPFGNGMMTVSDDGKHLFLATPSGVRMLDLIPPGTQTVTVNTDQIAANINFGSQQISPPTSSISGIVWNDINGNGLKDWNESGIAGRTVYLDQNQNGQLDTGEQSTITNTSGNYSFTGLTAGTYTVAELLSPNWNNTSPLGQGSLIPISDRGDLIFNSQRNLLYLTTSDGDVERYDVNAQTLLSPWRVGNSLNGGDITPDNSALYIAENQQGATQGFVRKVNLATGAVTNLTTPDASWDTNPSDVSIGSNGIGLVRRKGQWQSMLQLDLSTDTISTRTISGSLYGGQLIARSGDRSLMLIHGSDGLFTYNSTTNSFSAQKPANANSLFVVNRNGTLIAVEVGNSISILDANLNGVENLSNVDGGLAFDPTRDVLYAVSTATDHIIAFNTNTWQELYRLNIGENLGTVSSYDDPSVPLGNGMMTVSDDGKYLFLATPMGVRVFNLDSPTASSRSQTITLPIGQAISGMNFANQQVPTFAVNDVTVTEGNTGTKNVIFTVSLSVPATQTVTVDYATADGSAIAGTDYTATNGTLSFAPGETSKTVTVAIAGDFIIEGNESFTLNLSNPSASVPLMDAQGVATILDDDPNLTITSTAIAEGNNGTSNLVFTVNLSQSSTQPVSVNYATSNGSAIAGTDYTATNGTLTFAPGQTTQTITVPILGDTILENNETFFVNLSSASGATLLNSQAVGTILNDDSAPSVLSITDATVIEGNAGASFAAFTVLLSNASSQPVTVNYATFGGTATAGTDYIATNGTLSFEAGETLKTILVPIISDTLVESNETFFLYLSNANNALIGDIQGLGSIQNDDVA